MLPNAHLRPDEVIADFTGGTAAMSGGMVVDTLHLDRRLQYLSRQLPLVDQQGRALSAEEIVSRKVLIGVQTSSRLATGAWDR